jgi:hypothetical protein
MLSPFPFDLCIFTLWRELNIQQQLQLPVFVVNWTNKELALGHEYTHTVLPLDHGKRRKRLLDVFRGSSSKI